MELMKKCGTAKKATPGPGGKRKEARRTLARAVDSTCCQSCSKDLTGKNARALYVEEEVGRIFCSEDCIARYFTPDIERLEKEYHRHLSKNDLSPDERESLNHLRWLTLQNPEEVWVEKTLAGDHRYTLISQFMPEETPVWSICICLVLKGEPSFLYLSIPTRNAALVDFYRRGERTELPPRQPDSEDEERVRSPDYPGDRKTDRLASEWTEDETYLASISQERDPSDIPLDDYGLYQSCMEETLDEPEEVWCVRLGGETLPIYHFIRYYPDEKPGVWFVIVAREVDESHEQIEIVDAFPTRDRHLVEQFRKGEQEIGRQDARPTARVVH